MRLEEIDASRRTLNTSRVQPAYYASTDEEELQSLRDKLSIAVHASETGLKEANEAEESANKEAESMRGLQVHVHVHVQLLR